MPACEKRYFTRAAPVVYGRKVEDKKIYGKAKDVESGIQGDRCLLPCQYRFLF